MSRPGEPSILSGAVAATALVWAFELVLARTSFDRQAAADLVKSAAGLSLVGILPFLFLRSGRAPGPIRTGATALLAAAPLLLVTAGIIGPAALRNGRAVGLAVTGGALAAIAGWRIAAALRGGGPFPGPGAIAAVFAIAAPAAWLLQKGRLPPPGRLAATFVAGAILAALAARGGRATALAVGLAAAAALVPLPVGAPAWTGEGPPANGPDIILISIDTLRSDAVAEMESYRRLAASGVSLPATQAASPWTLPAMATVLTGLTVPGHGAGRTSRDEFHGLKPDTPTLAERLAAIGYDTAAVVNNPVLGAEFGFPRGFAVFHSAFDDWAWGLPAGLNSTEGRPVVCRLLLLARVAGRRPWFDASSVVRRARAILAGRRRRPVFLWLHFFDTHRPYRHAHEIDARWALRMELERGNRFRVLAQRDLWREGEGLRAMRAAYDNEVRHLDRALSGLLDALGPVPPGGRVIAFTSDHGEEFFEHGGYEHGHAVYQEVAAVPLVLAGLAGTAAGTTVEEPAGHIDIAPTLLAAAGAAESSLPGLNLAGPLPAGERALVTRQLLYGKSPDARIALREGRWKLIAGGDGPVELYDLGADPAETVDRAGDNGPLVARLLDLLSRDGAPAEGSPAGPEGTEALRSLGYIAD